MSRAEGWEQAQLGMDLTLEYEHLEWRRKAMSLLELFVATRHSASRFTADDIHEWWGAMALPPAHHPNVYGALLRQARNRELILPTGRMVPSSRTSRHASLIPEYRPGIGGIGE